MLKIKIDSFDNPGFLKDFFTENGLEVGNEPVKTRMVKCWKAVDDDGLGSLMGGATLGLRAGQYVVDGIAVDPQYRRQKIGLLMLDRLVKYAKRIGVKKLWLVAREPEFFRSYGFITIAREEAPYVFGCFDCEQYGRECKPEVMSLEL